MEVKPNPFSLYDFLGYFTPGAIAIYSGLLIHGHAVNPAVPEATLQQTFASGRGELYVPFVLFAYVLGHLLSYVSSITVERYSVWALGYPSKFLLRLPSPGYWDVEEPTVIRTLLRFIVGVLLAPVAVLDFLLGRGLRLRELYAKPLDELLIGVIKDKVANLVHELGITKTVKEKGSLKPHDYFRLIYHYAVENSPSHYPKLQNYVALYGFLRTLTLIFVCVFWATAWHAMAHPFRVGTALVLIGTTASLAYIGFAAFVKFYRRFTLEALMAVSVRPSASGS